MLMRIISRLRRGTAANRPVPRPRLLALESLEDREVPAIVYGLTAANTLVRFDSATPGALLSSAVITGLQNGNEHVIGIDYRPRTGQLIASTVPAGVAGSALVRTYYVNPLTGAATFIGSVPNTAPGAAD